MDERALGIFDSGVGGLTVAKAIRQRLPHEDLIYLGDTARVPYGNKSKETVIRYAREDCQFLLDRGVKAIVVACNTASAFALEVLQEELEVPLIGVIQPGVSAALQTTRSQKVGIIGTAGTIGSGAYQKRIKEKCPDIELITEATPLLVPLIEENWLEEEATRLVLLRYLRPFLEVKVDTLVLACTHYPLLKPVLQKVVGDEVSLVDSASTCALSVENLLREKKIEKGNEEEGKTQINLTDLPAHFKEMAVRFLDQKIEDISIVSLG